MMLKDWIERLGFQYQQCLLAKTLRSNAFWVCSRMEHGFNISLHLMKTGKGLYLELSRNGSSVYVPIRFVGTVPEMEELKNLTDLGVEVDCSITSQLYKENLSEYESAYRRIQSKGSHPCLRLSSRRFRTLISGDLSGFSEVFFKNIRQAVHNRGLRKSTL
jgi:hypothetical protein